MKPPNVVKVSQFKREFDNYENINESGLTPNVYLFVYFYEPAIVVIEGIEHLVEKNACIIYSPGVRQEYRNYNGVFINSFLALLLITLLSGKMVHRVMLNLSVKRLKLGYLRFRSLS